MILTPPTSKDWENVRQWRLTCPEALRTPYPLTYEEQQDHYRGVVANREAHAHTRWWMYGHDCALGLENLSSVNRRGEVSLIVNPKKRGKGLGALGFKALLHEAWYTLGLHSVYGEVYYCGALGFWQKVVPQLGGMGTRIYDTKWWDGKWWDSWLFTIVSPLERVKGTTPHGNDPHFDANA
jgi:GNAT superfamily N-acetyltransferase